MHPPSLAAAARRILLGNLRRGVASWNGQEYSFVCPSLRSYPFQWFWDSCFHAIALIHLDTVQARAELTTLLRAAQPSGFIPHLVFWEMEKQPQFLRRNLVAQTSPYFSATIQPPIIACAVERVYQATGDVAFRDAALPPLIAYYRWLREFRDPDGDGLIAIIQPEESGIDCSPKYDELLGLTELSNAGFIAALRKVYAAYAPLRGDDLAILAADVFHVEDVLVNTIYALGMRSLSRLLGAAPEAAEFAREADKTRDALLAKCWDEQAGAFFDLAGVAETPVSVVTISSLMPLALEDLPRPIVRRLVEQWLTSPQHFWLPYPMPSVPASDPRFLPGDPHGFIWRGPTWMNTNWFLARALRQHGYPELADVIVARSRELVEKSGFREYYHPYTGEGLGARDFGWSTLVLDM
ncbi:MAG: hypothetical protein EXR46_03235 [Dehalococcoidia bacterium]|nr:hypothetical protein [Dehalococcoidia bacterium]